MICAKCGTDNKTDAILCVKCGAQVSVQVAKTDRSVKEAEQHVETTRQGKVFRPGIAPAWVDPKAEPLPKCPHCKAVCPSNAVFCGQCGNPLKPLPAKPAQHENKKRVSRWSTPSCLAGFLIGAFTFTVLALAIYSATRPNMVTIIQQGVIKQPSPTPAAFSVELIESKTATEIQRSESGPLHANGTFVIITVRLTNNGEYVLALVPSSYQLRDENGQVFQPEPFASNAVGSTGDFYCRPLDSKTSSVRSFAFDVPNTQGLQLTVYSDADSKKDAVTLPIALK